MTHKKLEDIWFDFLSRICKLPNLVKWHSNGPIPTDYEDADFTTFHVSGATRIGFDSNVLNPNLNEDIVEQTRGYREYTLSLNAFRVNNGSESQLDPEDLLSKVELIIQSDYGVEYFITRKIAFSNSSDIRDLTALESGKWEKRAQMDITFSAIAAYDLEVPRMDEFKLAGALIEGNQAYPVNQEISLEEDEENRDFLFRTSAGAGNEVSPSLTTVDSTLATWHTGDGTKYSDVNGFMHTYSDGANFHDVDLVIDRSKVDTLTLFRDVITEVNLNGFFNARTVSLHFNSLLQEVDSSDLISCTLFRCYSTGLLEFDARINKSFTSLSLQNNASMTKVYLDNPALFSLFLSRSKLTELNDIDNCPAIKNLEVNENLLTQSSIDYVLVSLGDGNINNGLIDISNNPETHSCNQDVLDAIDDIIDRGNTLVYDPNPACLI